MAKKINGYTLTGDQQITIGNVGTQLVQAECYLESENVDNTMECYGDFKTLYQLVHKALEQVYDIMGTHNTTTYANKDYENIENLLASRKSFKDNNVG